MRKIIHNEKKAKVRAIQIQFKGQDEFIFFDLRRIALDYDTDQTNLCRLILTEWAWKYKREKEKSNGPIITPFQLPLFSEMTEENAKNKTKKEG